MKTRFFLLMLIAFALFSCQKEKTDPVTEQEVTFTATLVDPGAGLKNTSDWDWKCDPTLEPVYAEIDLLYPDGVTTATVKPLVFTLDGKLYTQAIKLPPGTYTVTKFLVMDDMGTPDDFDDDEIYMATPLDTSPYAIYTNPDIRFTFLVEEFKKAEIPVQVLCFIPAEYDGFGFDWFVITEIIVREQCFFGDLCVKHTDDYLGSHYALQPGGLKIDMPAIFRVDVYKGGVFVESFTNDVAPNYGVGSPVCVKYADILGVTDVFTFELWIMVKQGPNFPFVLFKTLTFNDIWNIEDSADDVYDFVLGNCNLTDPDLQLAPYINLPSTCTLMIGGTWGPGPVSGEYMDAILSSIPAGYELSNGTYGSYCYDRLTTINVNTNYAMDVYSSLYTLSLPLFLQAEEWDRVNWIINHLDNYAWGWSDLQQVIWILENPAWTGAAYGGCNAITAVGTAMYDDAVAYGDGYVPLPGGWAAVCFVPAGTPPDATDPVIQTVFVRVDP